MSLLDREEPEYVYEGPATPRRLYPNGTCRTCWLVGNGTDIPVFLLNVFAKNERVDLTQAERNEFKETLGELAAAYRKKRYL
jgi:hypothetical protein